MAGKGFFYVKHSLSESTLQASPGINKDAEIIVS